MKTPSKLQKSTLLFGAITLFVAHSTASAQSLSQVNGGDPILNINSVPSTTQGPAGTTGSDGYYFFEDTVLQNNQFVTADVVDLPGYVSSITEGAGVDPTYSATNSALTIGSTTYSTGAIEQFFPDKSDVPSSLPALATINLTDGVPSSFDVGILSDNIGNEVGSTFYYLTLYSSGGTQIGSPLELNTTVTGASGKNDFYFANISGAAKGDYIVVSGNDSSTSIDSSIGGLTFDTASNTPEPSTFVLFGLGALGLVLISRRALLRL